MTTNNPAGGSPSPSSLQRTPEAIAILLRQQGAIPVTIQASADLVKEALPHNSWLSDYQHVVEGKQVGYALRMTGEDLVYVKFPMVNRNVVANNNNSSNVPPSAAAPKSSTGGEDPNAATATAASSSTNNNNNNNVLPASLICVSFTIPKRFLVPVNQNTGNTPPAVPTPHHVSGGGGAVQNSSLGSAAAAGISGDALSKTNNINVSPTAAVATNNNGKDLTKLLNELGGGGGGGINSNTNGPKAGGSGGGTVMNGATTSNNNNNNNTSTGGAATSSKPLLCVVCGAWNTEGGQMRKSGFKCKNCIGKQSTARLKEAYNKLQE